MMSFINERVTLLCVRLLELNRERGQTLAEYSILVTVIAVGVVVTALLFFRGEIAGAIQDGSDCLNGVC
jgi:hypothetical protein